MNPSDFGQWYYLIYLLPFGLSFFMILGTAFGAFHRGGHGGVRAGHGAMGGGHGGHGAHLGGHGAHAVGHGAGQMAAGGHAHVAGRLHIGGHAHAGGHARAGGSGAHAHDGRAADSREGADNTPAHAIDHSGHPTAPTAAVMHAHVSALHPVLGFFGIGRAPTLMLAQGFGLAWGATGFYATRMLLEGGGSPVAAAPAALGMAALAGVVGAKVVGELGSRLMPAEETFATVAEDLVGLIGEVVFPVSATMGRVHVYDSFGTLQDISARLCPDETEPIGKGESVLLVRFDEASRSYRVERSPV